MRKQVTDPALLAQLDAPAAGQPKPVTDPAILLQLNGGFESVRQPAALAAPAEPEESLPEAFMSQMRGVRTGLHRIPQSAAELVLRGTDAVGLTDNAYPVAHRMFSEDNARYMGNSPHAKVGDVGGQILGTLPVGGIRAVSALPQLAKAGAATRFGTRLLDAAAQGGTAAALTSSASDAPLGEQIGTGAGIAASLPTLGAFVRGGQKLVPRVLGQTTGAGSQAVRTSYAAGREGGAAGQAFKGSMRGEIPWDQVVQDAKAALGNLRAERGKAYREGMIDISKDRAVLDFAPIDQAMAKASSIKNFKGVDTSPKTAGVRQEIDEAIAAWKQRDPAEFHTPEGFDALKQILSDIRDAQPFNSPQRTVADAAYNSVRKTIADQAPAYNKVMADYAAASDEISAIERELSLGKKVNPNTALRKLQSVLRDNANTSWGNRAKMADRLSEAGAPNLMPALAGQSLSTAVPRGLTKFVEAPTLAAASMFAPQALAAAPLMSPRVVGEMGYALGAGARRAGGILDYLPRGELPSLSPALGILGAASASR